MGAKFPPWRKRGGARNYNGAGRGEDCPHGGSRGPKMYSQPNIYEQHPSLQNLTLFPFALTPPPGNPAAASARWRPAHAPPFLIPQSVSSLSSRARQRAQLETRAEGRTPEPVVLPRRPAKRRTSRRSHWLLRPRSIAALHVVMQMDVHVQQLINTSCEHRVVEVLVRLIC